MSRKSNSDILAEYRGKLTISKQWVENDYHNLWNRLINLYRGKHYNGSMPFDRMLVNMAFATINVLYPSVSIGRPKIVVSPQGPDDADKAVIAEAIVNYWWIHYQCQEEFQLAVRDFLILGHGWVKSGYRYIEEDIEVESTDDEAADTSKFESSTETNIIIKEDRPFIERVDPFNMFVDVESTSMKDLRWIAQRIRRPIKDVKADKRYDYSARQEVSPSSYMKMNLPNGRTGPNGGVGENGNMEGFCDIYEFYDISTGKMCVFADTGDKFLVKPTEMPYAFGHPFTMLRNYDIPNYFYPMGELEAIEPLQHELNETRTQMMNHRKRYSRKYLFKENAFDDFGRQALTSDEDNAMVPVKGDENINNVVTPMPALINPPDFYNQSSLIISDMDRVSGLSDYQRGILPEVRRTATEASILQGSADARAAEKLTIIELGIAKVAYRLIKLAQQFMTEEQTVRVLDKPGKWAWVQFDKDYIDGNFDFTVEAGSTVPMNESFRRQRALQIVDAMAPFAQAGVIKLDSLAKLVLEQGFGVKDIERFINEPEEGPIPEEAPPGMPPGMPPQGELPPAPEGELPPELAAIIQGGGQAPLPPEMAAQGVPPMEMAPQGMEGLPPELAGVPPELLAQIMGEGMPPAAMAPQVPMQLPPELAQIPGSELIPPEILVQLPPEIIQEIVARGGFTPEVMAVLVESGILPPA
jgi:hypothetical protein